MSSARVGTAFAETFALNRPALAGLLRLSQQGGGVVDKNALKSELLLGNNYIKAMPRYARACGLMEFATYALTPLGTKLITEDPQLTTDTTQWLMHYHLSAPQGPGPDFWHHLVMTMPPPGTSIDRREAGRRVGEFLQASKNESLKPDTLEAAAGSFLSSYVKSDALGGLGILDDSATSGYQVGTPTAPSASVVGYALADYWDAHFSERKSISLSELVEGGSLGPLFFMGAGLFTRKLSELQRAGFLQLQRAVHPFQLVRLWEGKTTMIPGLYV